VIEKDLPVFAGWTPSYTMETVLSALRQELANSVNKKLPQPEEGTSF
jgi:ubiquitin-conjugating enzyme E2 variant